MPVDRDATLNSVVQLIIGVPGTMMQSGHIISRRYCTLLKSVVQVASFCIWAKYNNYAIKNPALDNQGRVF